MYTPLETDSEFTPRKLMVWSRWKCPKGTWYRPHGADPLGIIVNEKCWKLLCHYAMLVSVIFFDIPYMYGCIYIYTAYIGKVADVTIDFSDVCIKLGKASQNIPLQNGDSKAWSLYQPWTSNWKKLQGSFTTLWFWWFRGSKSSSFSFGNCESSLGGWWEKWPSNISFVWSTRHR